MAEEFHRKVTHSREAFPDLHKEPIDIMTTEDAVVVPYTMTGAHKHELMGIPVTGNEVEIGAVDIVYVDDGLIEQEWYVANFMRMMRQLGVADRPNLLCYHLNAPETSLLNQCSKSCTP